MPPAPADFVAVRCRHCSESFVVDRREVHRVSGYAPKERDEIVCHPCAGTQGIACGSVVGPRPTVVFFGAGHPVGAVPSDLLRKESQSTSRIREGE